MKYRSLLAVVAAFGVVSCGAEKEEAPAAPEDFEAEQRIIPDTEGTGPYASLIEVDPALADYVIYRPADLSKVPEGKLGVFVWGNGGCTDDGTSSRLHLSEIASHGYLVIAPGKWRNGPNAKEAPAERRQPDADGMLPPPPTSAEDLTKAIDWALAEGKREGSQYASRIDDKAVAVGGFSCGGVQALQVAGDPRIRTLVVQNSGILPEEAQRIPGMVLRKDALDKIHTPVIYIQGDKTDIAYENGLDDFGRINKVPAAWVSLKGKGHEGTYFEPNGGKAAQVAVAWLNWQLRGDTEAGKSFLGDACGLCGDSEVEFDRKNLR